ncbi:xanthine dehydrogenase family protein molybdopterin-binding subunit [Antarcticirhabdus aurantiaca]|uniref:Xanthine dehydrogenase family protein molybdopterin-binding subunit n=1 Tax=Antarcticirhabdus aurantiaca TaxID=2606717 RepID=A0ACD4NXK7_9HYPH|nr:xanthine dehydrogenase family protein molybdopterin-binding subunit [Antarcticirhabdus aurantiaca]WAJ31490.1 xanthine dehydrogenase family protein molybdopterin-binding subunit [Jeongeuplla avenae]
MTQVPADRPIGRAMPRAAARRHAAGRGRFVDDIAPAGCLHIAFLRSPHAHARILSVDLSAALDLPGVVDAFDGPACAELCKPWIGTLDHFPGLRSPEQHALAVDVARWSGEPVAAVVATSRAIAEDALDLIEAEFEELPAVTDIEAALDPDSARIHADYDSNLAFRLDLTAGEPDAAFAGAAAIVERSFRFNRQTGVTLEPRSLLADFQPGTGELTVHHSTQTPYQMHDVYSRHFGIPEERVRVVAPDVGGSFGLKLHVYGEEMAAVAASIRTGRPVKFVADRYESFLTDIHLRDHRVHARMGVAADGEILAMEVDDATGIGPFSVYPRTSAVEGNQAIRLMGAPYRMQSYKGRLSVLFQNKAPTCQYRAVGHPIACMATEALVDAAAGALGLDPLDIRRRNVVPDDAYPYRTANGYMLEGLSHHACLEKLSALMDYDALRRDQAEARARGVHRGIGLAVFVEITNPGPAFYGVGGARISAQDGCTVKLEPSGGFSIAISITEQGQGTEAISAQIAADRLGVSPERISVVSGDTRTTPYGGATWASRGAGIGGVAVMKAAEAMRANLLGLAGTILQASPESLDIREGTIVDAQTGTERMSLAELGRILYFRPDTLPPGTHPLLTVSGHHVPQGYPFAFTNGIQASHVEVDPDTGLVELLGHWVVEDCGTIINPLLVDEQIRGGVVHGLGGALFEECNYSPEGQLLSTTLADYLVPLASEMPDIKIAHVATPTKTSPLGAKGVGEAGTAASGAALLNAVNDALSPFGAVLAETPLTPERVLRALGKV